VAAAVGSDPLEAGIAQACMEDYLKRGGGLVSIHDTLCGDDPQYFSTIVGGAKKHGEQNFWSGAIKYSIVDDVLPGSASWKKISGCRS